MSARAAFEESPYSAREAALATASLADGVGASALARNPALLGPPSAGLSITEARSPALPGMDRRHLFAVVAGRRAAWGVGASDMGGALYRERGITAGGALGGSGLRGGASLEYQEVIVRRWGRASRVVGRVGLSGGRPGWAWSLRSPSYRARRGAVDADGGLGVKVDAVPGLQGMGALTLSPDGSMSLRAGVEFFASPRFRFRAGLRRRPDAYTGGFGFELGARRALDYAAVVCPDLPLEHVVTLRFSFQGAR